MLNPSSVWKRLTDEVHDSEPSKPRRHHKRRLTGDEYDNVLATYWNNRRDDAHDRDHFVVAAKDWVVFAFLHQNADRGQARNHEIAAPSDNIDDLIDRLDESCIRMIRNIRCKVEMRSVCWWDVQEHYHNLKLRDINRLADDLMDPLILEAIKELMSSGFLSWHSGFWNLSTTMSEPYIRELKHAKRIFLAPPPSKLSGVYAIA